MRFAKAALAALLTMLALAVGILVSAGAVNNAIEGPVRFQVDEARQWAGPPHQRFAFWWGATTLREKSMSFRLHVDDVPDGTTCKLWGLSAVTTRSGRLAGHPAGWRSALYIAHEDSDRFVFEVASREAESDTGDDIQQKGVRIRTYAYRDGEGAVTGSDRDDLSETLGFVPSGEWFATRLRVEPSGTLYELDAEGVAASHRTERGRTLSALRAKHFVHCDGGERQPVSPATIRLEARKGVR